MSQIALPLQWPAGEGQGDFLVSSSNEAIVRHFEHWSVWPVMASMLTGPRKSGRSLLGRIVAARFGGELIDAAEDQEEERLFHAWNRAQERRRPLVLVVDAPPPAWIVRLPDLRSRLAATPVVRLPEPDDRLAAQLIEKRCQVRGLPAGPDVIRYLLPRIDRSYLAIDRLIDALDEQAFERQQGLTVPLARRALERIGVIDESHSVR